MSSDLMITILFWFFVGPTILGACLVALTLIVAAIAHAAKWVMNSFRYPQ